MGAAIPEHSKFSCQQLEAVFHDCFFEAFNTRLVGGADEPLYQPAALPGQAHLLHYREDYFASALHEVAHWCIAGERRRGLVDFGYWYAPDGRSAAQQRDFEAVEYKPQALEWHFARACGYRFRISLGNLDGIEAYSPSAWSPISGPRSSPSSSGRLFGPASFSGVPSIPESR